MPTSLGPMIAGMRLNVHERKLLLKIFTAFQGDLELLAQNQGAIATAINNTLQPQLAAQAARITALETKVAQLSAGQTSTGGTSTGGTTGGGTSGSTTPTPILNINLGLGIKL